MYLLRFFDNIIAIGRWILDVGFWTLDVRRWTLYVSLITLVLLTACSPKISVQKNEYLLGNQTFSGNKTISSEELALLLPQKPNKNLMGIPTTMLVYKWQEPKYLKQKVVWQRQLDSLSQIYEDTMSVLVNSQKQADKVRRKLGPKLDRLRKKIDKGNGAMRFWGSEAPVYFLETDALQNTHKIRTYLINHGFFYAKVSFTTDTLLKRVRSNYIVDEGKAYKLRQVNLTSNDSTINQLLRDTKTESFLKSGDNYSYPNIQQEIERIENLMQDNGYIGFSKEFLRPVGLHGGFIIDTNIVVPATDSIFKSVDIKGLQVNYARNQTAFRQYKYNTPKVSVESVIDDLDLQEEIKNDTIFYQNTYYYFDKNKYKPKYLSGKILIKHDSIARRSILRETQMQLSLLDQFEFIKIDADTLNGQLNPVIRVIPLKKFSTVNDIGFTMIQGATGVGFASSFKIRNIANSLGNLSLGFRGSYDWQTGYVRADTLIQTLELGLNASLSFPRLLFVRKFDRILKQNYPQTIVSLDYSYSDHRPDFIRQGVRSSMVYSWRKNNNEAFVFSPIDLSFIRTDTTSAEFAQRLREFEEEGNPLIRTFERRSLVSGMSFSYLKNTRVPTKNIKANYLSLTAETGGWLSSILLKNNSVETYQFIKTAIDYRTDLPVGLRSSFVLRANLGLLWGNNGAPYEKYFTLGGSTSMRAWKPRRLGVGAAYPSVLTRETLADGSIIAIPRFTNQNVDPSESSFDYRFEQLGNVVMEYNAEFRFKFFRFAGFDFNWAFFLDVGNVWSLPQKSGRINDQNSQNAAFSLKNFYKQLAVGTGTGLRVDFSYFVIRLDAGIKVYDPTRIYSIIDPVAKKIIETRDERFMLKKLSFNRNSPFFIQPQIGIGYPF